MNIKECFAFLSNPLYKENIMKTPKANTVKDLKQQKKAIVKKLNTAKKNLKKAEKVGRKIEGGNVKLIKKHQDYSARYEQQISEINAQIEINSPPSLLKECWSFATRTGTRTAVTVGAIVTVTAYGIYAVTSE
jgi:hypothetical protein